MAERMLRAPIKEKWFRMTLSGEKEEEYRDITPYWTTRLANVIGVPVKDVIKTAEKGNITLDLMLTAGYGGGCPSLVSCVTLAVGIGRPEWGASGQRQFIFHHHHFRSVMFGNKKNWEELEKLFYGARRH